MKLKPLIGEKYELLNDLSEKVKGRKFADGEENLKVLKVILIRDKILSTVNIVGQIIALLYNMLTDLEYEVEQLLPRDDYEWNRNLTLTDRMEQSLQVLENYEKYDINEIVDHLYKVLSYFDEAIDTIEYYNERKEMLLNYPVFEKKIRRILEERSAVTIEDMGVTERYGMEYLKMYHRTNLDPLIIDESMSTLRRTSDD